MRKFLKFLILRNVDEELGKAVQDELAFINEDVDFVLQELLAIIFHLLWHGGTEHHNLLMMRCANENILNVSSHMRRAKNLITLVNHKKFALK